MLRPSSTRVLLMPAMLDEMLRAEVFVDIIQSRSALARLAIRTRVHIFPEEVYSTWVMLAVTAAAAR